MNIEFSLTAPPGEKIELLFEKFAMDTKNNPGCRNQGLAILDPAQSRVPGQTEIFCGTTPPAPFKSRGNKLFLKLESNTKFQGEGWLIKYRIKQVGMDNRIHFTKANQTEQTKRNLRISLKS